MKKLLILTVLFSFWNSTVFALTLDERLAKIDASSQRQIERVATYKTYTEEMRKVKVDQIKATAELKKTQTKEWQALKDKIKAEKAEAKKAKKAEKQSNNSAK